MVSKRQAGKDRALMTAQTTLFLFLAEVFFIWCLGCFFTIGLILGDVKDSNIDKPALLSLASLVAWPIVLGMTVRYMVKQILKKTHQDMDGNLKEKAPAIPQQAPEIAAGHSESSVIKHKGVRSRVKKAVAAKSPMKSVRDKQK